MGYNCFGYALNKKMEIQPFVSANDLEEGLYSNFHAYIYEKISTGIMGEIVISSSEFAATIIATAQLSYGVNIRKLDSLYEDLYNHEYRIAFRIGSSDYINEDNIVFTSENDFYEKIFLHKMVDFHFLRQNNTLSGSWSGKPGDGELITAISLGLYTWPIDDTGYKYDSETVYFAVSVL